MIYKSFAKVNLFLLVKKQKNQPLHKIRSLFYLHQDLYDEITFELTKNNQTVQVDYTFDQNHFLNPMKITNCIFVKTWKTLSAAQRLQGGVGVKIKVLKRIPVGAGLGGAASNAACFLHFLKNNHLIKGNNHHLQKIILQIGSDVAFFFENAALAFVFGYGNKVITIKRKYDLSLQLFLNPETITLTKTIYEKHEQLKKEYVSNSLLQMWYWLTKQHGKLLNHLETAFWLTHPEIKTKVLKIKNKIGKRLFLNGSGSSFFAFP